MQHMTRELFIAAAFAVVAVQAGAAEPLAPRPAPAAAHDPGTRGGAVRPAVATRSNLDPLRGPVANDPRAYPYEAVKMQPRHTWSGHADK